MIHQLFARLTDSGRQALVLTGINSVFWFAWAFGSYQTIYLQQAGFTASQLGVLNALTSIFSRSARLLAFWGMVSDRMGSLRKVLILVLLGGSLLFCPLSPLIPHRAAHLPRAVLLPGAGGVLLPGLHVHLRRKHFGAQLQRAAAQLRPAAQRGLLPLYDWQLPHLLSAAHGGGGLHLLDGRPADPYPRVPHLLRPGAQRPARREGRGQAEAEPGGAVPEQGLRQPACFFGAAAVHRHQLRGHLPPLLYGRRRGAFRAVRHLHGLAGFAGNPLPAADGAPAQAVPPCGCW